MRRARPQGRERALLLSIAACTAILASGCARSSPPAPASPATAARAVVARLGAPPGDAGHDAAAPRGVERLAPRLAPGTIQAGGLGERNLSGATRQALCFTPESTAAIFTVEIESSIRAILLSIGIDAPRFATDHAVFTIEREESGKPVETLLRETIGPHAWTDRKLELDAAPEDGAGSATLLRFRAERAAQPAARHPAASGAPAARNATTSTTGDGVTPSKAGAPLCWGSIVFVGDVPASAPALPDVVLVSLDTLGAVRLGHAVGDERVTPRLDAFLAKSFTFEHAYAPFGHTFPSHSSLLSGLMPLHHGRYQDVAERAPALASLVVPLAEAGYLTAAVTEDGYVAARLGFATGFDWYDDGDVRPLRGPKSGAAGTFAEAQRVLDELGSLGRLFLFVHTYEVHEPYTPHSADGRRLADTLTPGDTRVFTPKEQRRMRIGHNRRRNPLTAENAARLAALHTGEVRSLDDAATPFLDSLEAREAVRDTLVVITADHGERIDPKGRIGHTMILHDDVLRVPLAMRWAGRIAPGSSAVPAQLVDVLPTVFDLVGLEASPDLDGRSLGPVLRGAREDGARPAVAEMFEKEACTDPAGGEPCRRRAFAVSDGRFKLLVAAAGDRAVLFDLEADPDETRDVAAAHPERVTRLRGELDRYLGAAHERAARPAPAVPGPTPPGLDAEARKRLRALGYVDE